MLRLRDGLCDAIPYAAFSAKHSLDCDLPVLTRPGVSIARFTVQIIVGTFPAAAVLCTHAI